MKNNTHEPHSRSLPALLALRPLARGRTPSHGRRLPARLARSAPPLAWRPPRRILRWPGDHLPGPGIADRTVRRLAASGPYAAARAAHDGGAAAFVARRAALHFASRPAATN